MIATNHTMLNLIGQFRYSKSKDKKWEISNDWHRAYNDTNLTCFPYRYARYTFSTNI